jgi:hypothetical protein
MLTSVRVDRFQRSGIRVPPAYAQPLLRFVFFETIAQIVLNILDYYQSCWVVFGVIVLDVTAARTV